MDFGALARRLGQTTTFSALEAATRLALVSRARRGRARVGETIADAADGLSDHLVLLAGAVEVERRWLCSDGQPGASSHRVAVDDASPGFALVSAGGRQLRVRAVADTDYLAIDSDEVDDLLGWGHLGACVLPEPHLKVFHRLPLDNVARAIPRLVERSVSAGETIVREGEQGDQYFVILEGEADVFERDADGSPRQVNRLVDGDAFGEEALLAGSTRTATVRMATPGRLLSLDRAQFDALLGPSTVEEVDAIRARGLIADGRVHVIDCRDPGEFEAAHIPCALPLPLGRLRHDGVFALDPTREYLVCCGSGRRSRAAVFLLHERGLRARVLAGGLAAWPYELAVGPA
ncbi:MAG: cyclic nucleotide-binding domain-containing protein [Rubrivivax sp.]|jgi:rhodanese-related sulfurtransferase|nr:cyclic nucleotide-binding domain-containing protein [Rubrivivax sp.]